MTDRTHPDSGCIITSSDILLHDAQTALMYEELRAAIDDGHESMTHADALAEIAAIRAENTMLRQHAAKQITDATLLTGISPRNGGVDIGLEGGACQLLAEAFFDQFVEAGAVNFLEVRLESSTRMPGKAMTVTMQLADGVTPGQKIAEANARIAELEAQLAAIGAGGVSGPLMGKPQEMPDLSALTERGAKAWACVDAQELRGGGADISKEREDFNAWLRTYEEEVGAIDEAAAWAGFSGARASLAASAWSEPVATIKSWTNGGYWRNYKVEWHRNDLPEGAQLYLHPSPPEGMVGGWISVKERLPQPFKEVVVYPRPDDYCCEVFCDMAGNWKWAEYEHNFGVHHRECQVEYWLMLPEVPAPATTSAGSGKGD